MPGKPGRNFLLKSDGRTINLQGKTSVDIASGVSFAYMLLNPIDYAIDFVT